MATVPLATQAQQRIFRIGYIGNSSPELDAPLLAGLRKGMSEQGYIEGRDITFEIRWAGGEASRLPALAAELIALPVDVIVVSGTPATQAAFAASRTVPIVMAAIGDAVGSGIVPSLARPDANITGLSTLYPELEGKRLEILMELMPTAKRISYLMNPANPFMQLAWKEASAAAAARGLATDPIEVSKVEHFDGAFAAIARHKSDALVVIADRPFLISNRTRIVAFAAQQRLPAIYPYREFVDEGGLVCYGPDFTDMFRRSARYVARILRGAKPSELPLEQPTKFELVVNATTAKALNLALPQNLLARAEVII